MFEIYEIVVQDVVVSCPVASIGKVGLKLVDGICRALNYVRHIPDVKKNLISLSALDSKGYTFSGEDGVLRV